MLTQNNLLADGNNFAAWQSIALRQSRMCVPPLHQVNVIVVTLMSPLYAGGSVVLKRKFKSSIYWTRLA